MVHKIERDLNRFKQIVRGKIRENLRKYVSQGEMIGKQGKEFVSIPIPQLDTPAFATATKATAASQVARVNRVPLFHLVKISPAKVKLVRIQASTCGKSKSRSPS